MGSQKKACFFARVKDRGWLDSRQWYANDIRILRDLGFEVVVAIRFSEIPSDCDLYFSWWATGSIFPLVRAKLSRKPIVVVAGGLEAIRAREMGYMAEHCYSTKPFYVRAAVRLCLRHADVVLAVSKRVLEEVKALGAKNPILVYNVVDTERFTAWRGDVPRKSVLSLADLTSGAYGVKNVEALLRSMPYVLKEFPNQEFVILGEKAEAYAKAEKLVQELGIENHVSFAGRVPNERVKDYLDASKVLVQISKYETFGMAIAEAMACGVPVVVSDVGAVREVVGECGVYADSTSPRDVAEKICLLLKDETRREELSTKGRKRIEEGFSYSVRKERIRQILNDLMC